VSGLSPEQPSEPQHSLPEHAQQPQYAQPQYPQQQYTQPQYPQQPQYVQPVYPGQPTYLVTPPAPPRGKSIASMVLGLVSVFFGFTLLVPVIGFILGLTALKSEPAGRGMAITGIVLNGLMLLGWIVVVGLFLLFVVGIGAASYGTSVSV
jgi:hypothetical protein